MWANHVHKLLETTNANPKAGSYRNFKPINGFGQKNV